MPTSNSDERLALIVSRRDEDNSPWFLKTCFQDLKLQPLLPELYTICCFFFCVCVCVCAAVHLCVSVRLCICVCLYVCVCVCVGGDTITHDCMRGTFPKEPCSLPQYRLAAGITCCPPRGLHQPNHRCVPCVTSVPKSLRSQRCCFSTLSLLPRGSWRPPEDGAGGRISPDPCVIPWKAPCRVLTLNCWTSLSTTG